MSSLEEKLQSLAKEIEHHQRLSQRRAIALTFIPVFLAVLFILSIPNFQQGTPPENVSVIKELQSAKQQIASLQMELEGAKQQIVSLQRLVAENKSIYNKINQDYLEAKYLGQHIYMGEFFSHFVSQTYPKQSEILEDIKRMKKNNVNYKPGGFSPEEGFDSAGFVTYILVKHKLLSISDPYSSRYDLNILLTSTTTPSIGDIIFYKPNYFLFYFQDNQHKPFVIGMTPLGILALEFNFAPIIGIGNVEYIDTDTTGASGASGPEDNP